MVRPEYIRLSTAVTRKALGAAVLFIRRIFCLRPKLKQKKF